MFKKAKLNATDRKVEELIALMYSRDPVFLRKYQTDAEYRKEI